MCGLIHLSIADKNCMKIAKGYHSNHWKKELNDLIRGASGGFLFGIPLIYTMEVWWIGSSVNPIRILVALSLTFAIVFILNCTDGFRTASNTDIRNVLMDSVESFALGLICTGIVLVLLREITLTTPLTELLGKLVYESIPFTLGIALANQFLGGNEEQSDSKDSASRSSKAQQETLNATLSDIGATLIGAVIIAFSIAPTDEVTMLAAAVSEPWLLAVMLASLLISYVIVFVAGFANQQKRQQQQGIFQRPISETMMSYLVSLFAAMMMLIFFDKLGWEDPWQIWLSHTLILGLPATIGGAAGRLAV